jgi:hypothetical protein
MPSTRASDSTTSWPAALTMKVARPASWWAWTSASISGKTRGRIAAITSGPIRSIVFDGTPRISSRAARRTSLVRSSVVPRRR